MASQNREIFMSWIYQQLGLGKYIKKKCNEGDKCQVVLTHYYHYSHQ